jgi:hypothetical protein
MDNSNSDWTFTDVAWKNSYHPSLSRVSFSSPFLSRKRRERRFPSQHEYGNHEQPGSAHYHPSHMAPASLTSEDPSFRPRGILTAGFQYPFHHEPSFIAPHQDIRPIGHPSPTSPHTISAHATLYYPTMSGAPSLLPSSSFYTPPPHHPGWSPAPFGHPPYDHRLFLSPVPPVRRVDNQVHHTFTFPSLGWTAHDRLPRYPAGLSIDG